MSLLNRSTDVVTVYPEEVARDQDGNKQTRAAKVGIVSRAVVQPISTAERDRDGVSMSEERLRLRLVGWQGDELGAQSQVEWEGRRYAIRGEAQRHRGSRRTAHVTYTLVRQ